MSLVFARNFDAEMEGLDETATTDAGESDPKVSLEQAHLMIEEARREAFEDGRRDGAASALVEERASRSARTDEAVEVVARQLVQLAKRDASLRAEVELEMAELIIGIAERVLPDLFDVYLPEFLLARIRSGLSIASGNGQISVRVAPGLEGSLAPRIAHIADRTVSDSISVSVVADSTVEDGAVRVEWQSGFMEYDPIIAGMEALETLREAVEELKSKLGDSE